MRDNWRYQVLTTDDREAWRSLVAGAPERDAFFTQEYATLFERHSDEPARLFCYGNEVNYIVYSFCLRRINGLPFFRAAPLNGETEYYDIASPYGYSGPLVCARDQGSLRALWQGFVAAFHQYCCEAHIVCEFARLNPFTGNHKHLRAETQGVRASGRIVYVDLTKSEQELWQGLNRGNRSNINKAKRSGVRVDLGDGGEDWQRFYQLYVAAMRRNHANRWYYFSPEFFSDCSTLLEGKISLFCARYEDRNIAAASFLHDGDVVHYFLGGSDADYLALRPNNLLMYRAIGWAKEQGYRLFNLGGNYGTDDSLIRFKAGFSKLQTTFHTYRTIHNPMVYEELCRRYEAFNSNLGRQRERSDYFPLYRAGGSR